MAINIIPQSTGRLVLEDENGKVVGTGRAKASKSLKKYVTLTLNMNEGNFLVVRVPIDWTDRDHYVG